jgi:hypothetical protein
MTWLRDADNDLVMVPRCWTIWRKGQWEYRQSRPGIIEARWMPQREDVWRPMEAA